MGSQRMATSASIGMWNHSILLVIGLRRLWKALGRIPRRNLPVRTSPLRPRRRGCALQQCTLVGVLLCAAVSLAAAQEASALPAPDAALTQKIAVWRFDALGIEPELVARLEALFRSELDRLTVTPMPTRRDLERSLPKELSDCTGEDRCLAAIGKRLAVDVMVAGSVGALGDNYVLSIKVVEVTSAKQLRRITTDPLRGTPDDLIDAVRVAAYRLLAPERLHGSISILSDLVGAEVLVDGKRMGRMPLPSAIGKLALGPHTVTVSAKGYARFEETVDVRFQKTARVEVRMVPELVTVDLLPTPRAAVTPWYTRTWVIVAIGLGAVVAGAVVGHELGAIDRRCANCGVIPLWARP